jgi:hypothetical protein
LPSPVDVFGACASELAVTRQCDPVWHRAGRDVDDRDAAPLSRFGWRHADSDLLRATVRTALTPIVAMVKNY